MIAIKDGNKRDKERRRRRSLLSSNKRLQREGKIKPNQVEGF
jgi:hypothetical protein